MSNNPTKQTSNTLRMYMLVFVVVVFNIKKKKSILEVHCITTRYHNLRCVFVSRTRCDKPSHDPGGGDSARDLRTASKPPGHVTLSAVGTGTTAHNHA